MTLLLLLLFVCNGMTHMLHSADDTTTLYVANGSTVHSSHKLKNLTTEITGDNSHVDLTRASISDTLTITIEGNDNTVVMKHPNTLTLIIRGKNNKVTNLCRRVKAFYSNVSGENSGYSYIESGLSTLSKIMVACVVSAGIIVYLSYGDRLGSFIR